MAMQWNVSSFHTETAVRCHKYSLLLLRASQQQSGLTSCACSTRVALCWRTASTTLMAAARLKLDWDLQATRRGYMRAWGWCLPMRTSRLCISRLTGCTVVWMRAITCTTGVS